MPKIIVSVGRPALKSWEPDGPVCDPKAAGKYFNNCYMWPKKKTLQGCVLNGFPSPLKKGPNVFKGSQETILEYRFYNSKVYGKGGFERKLCVSERKF